MEKISKRETDGERGRKRMIKKLHYKGRRMLEKKCWGRIKKIEKGEAPTASAMNVSVRGKANPYFHFSLPPSLQPSTRFPCQQPPERPAWLGRWLSLCGSLVRPRATFLGHQFVKGRRTSERKMEGPFALADRPEGERHADVLPSFRAAALGT